MRVDALTAHYRTLEGQLLTRWDAPLVNDFFAMIFYGALRALSTKWLGDGAGTLQNDLLVGEGEIVSAEPARRLQALAQIAAEDPGLVTVLVERPLGEIQAAFATTPNRRFMAEYDSYLAKFSDRCLDELKLESPTLADDPLMLLRTIGQLAQRQRASRIITGSDPMASTETSAARATDAIRAGAEARVATALRGHPLRRLIFGWVMRQARARVRHRENLRFERTRVFGRVRRIFIEAGKRLAGEGLLAGADDVFYLQVDEVLGVVEGTVTTASLAALADVRRREYDAYRTMAAPADRFETRGAVWVGNRFQASAATAASAGDALSEDERRGIGCCPGVIEGRAQVIRDPRGVSLAPGDILVAERTDPGWILLFPAAAAVVVERGSVLSHSAIVARELGLPAVVSLPGLTSWLATGDRISVDGSTGVVRRIARGSAAA
jgi:pyruvate,water dikinase